MAEVEQPKIETPAFDAAAHMQKFNERQEAQRSGKPLPKVPQPEVRLETKAEPEEKPERHGLTRSQVRAERQRAEALGEERGRRLALEEMLAKNAQTPAKAAPTNEDPEPKREGYATEPEYYRALGRWDARQEANKAVTKITDKQDEEATKQRLMEAYQAADAKVAIDKEERFPDWSELVAKAQADSAKRAEESEDGKDPLEMDRPDTPTFNQMFHLSKQKAALMVHFVKNPDILGEFLGMEDGSVEQILALKELEGELKVLYPKKQKQEAKPESESAAERDARKHRPSNADAPKGGSVPATTISPVLPDGTLNPAWKAQRNERLAARR